MLPQHLKLNPKKEIRKSSQFFFPRLNSRENNQKVRKISYLKGKSNLDVNPMGYFPSESRFAKIRLASKAIFEMRSCHQWE